MFQTRLVLKSFFTLALLTVTPVLVLAQNSSPPANPDDQIVEDQFPPGTVDCFDYYHFQSVQVSAATDKKTYGAGEEIKFKGNVTNENNYPVVDGYVFVRLGPVNIAYRSEGHNIADEFFAVEKIVLDGKTAKPLEFKWHIPKGALSGEYIANYFFSVGKRFNLGGLPFSNEVIIGSTKFKVTNAESGGLLFDRKATKVNGNRYIHIGDWPVINPGAKVVIEQPLKNTGKREQEANITYELYYWDGLRAEDLIDSRTEKVILVPGFSQTLRYEIPNMDTSVYYLKIMANSGDSRSIVNIRIASDQARPRINYPAITKFPVASGDKFSVFSCFHNTSNVNAEGKVTVVLKDRAGNRVGEASYNGVIPPDMLAVAGDIVAAKSYDYLALRAEISNAAGEIIDSYDTVYDCNDLKSSACGVLPGKPTVPKGFTRGIFMLVLGGVLLLILAIWWIVSMKKRVFIKT